MSTVIYIGADHAGYTLKEHLVKELSKTCRVVDLGAHNYVATDDYPDVAFRVGRRVAKHEAKGILICGSSEGVCIAANKVKGVRAVSCTNQKLAKLAREHNDANVLCLSGWNLKSPAALGIIHKFLSTPFSEEDRHIRRINKITRYEK